MDEQQIVDDGDLRKYRTELPNMADDELDPFQYRLYGHYKRVCGANGGTCREAVRTTATKCKMSTDKVISTRQWLADNGWIEIEQDAKGLYHVRIADRWVENFVRYSERKTFDISNTFVRDIEHTVRDIEHVVFDISNQRKNNNKKEPSKKEPKKKEPDFPPPPQPSTPTRNRKSDPDYDRICTAIEGEGLGMMTPALATAVKEAMDKYPVAWILKAVEISVMRNKRTWGYVNGILGNFEREGFDGDQTQYTRERGKSPRKGKHENVNGAGRGNDRTAGVTATAAEDPYAKYAKYTNGT